MQLFVLGTSHSVAPAQVREQLHVAPQGLREALSRLTGEDGLLKEAVVLSTCARDEVYAVSAHPGVARKTLTRYLARTTGVSVTEIQRHTYFATGQACVDHLFRTAAGLDSAVQGEGQILGQVRKALSEGPGELPGPWLQRLFQDAVVTGRRVRTETELGRGHSSMVGAALHLMRGHYPNLDEARICVVGAGETGLLMAESLMKLGAQNVTILNRTLDRALSVAESLGAEGGRLSDLPGLLADTDILIGAVAASGFVVTRGQIEDLQANGASIPRLFVDLSHPRVLDPALFQLSEVALIDLDLIQKWAVESGMRREREVPLAEGIVEEEVQRHEEWLRSRENLPVVRAVRQRVLGLTQRYVAQYARGRTPDERQHLERFGRSLARAILHEPTVALRSADLTSPDGKALLDAAAALFGLHDLDEGASPGTQEAERSGS